MAVLPDDVFLLIFSNTDIDTFLMLRLLNHKIYALISAHIHGLTQAVAQATFPRQTRILIRQHAQMDLDSEHCLRRLKGLRYHQLAAILLEGGELHSIAAEDPLGDKLRDAVAEGWRVMSRFCQIAREVSLLSPEDIPVREVAQTDGGAPGDGEPTIADRRRELESCARKLRYIETLPLETLEGYQYIRRELPKAFGFGDSWEPPTRFWKGTGGISPSYEEQKIAALCGGLSTERQSYFERLAVLLH